MQIEKCHIRVRVVGCQTMSGLPPPPASSPSLLLYLFFVCACVCGGRRSTPGMFPSSPPRDLCLPFHTGTVGMHRWAWIFALESRLGPSCLHGKSFTDCTGLCHPLCYFPAFALHPVVKTDLINSSMLRAWESRKGPCVSLRVSLRPLSEGQDTWETNTQCPAQKSGTWSVPWSKQHADVDTA